MAKKKPAAPAAEPAETPAPQPYYLQKAHVKDYRSVRDAAVEFKPGLNIIIGPNGAGKTNFLRAVEAGIGERSESKPVPGSSFDVLGRSHLSISYKARNQPTSHLLTHPEDAISATIASNSSTFSGSSLHQAISQLAKAQGERPYWLNVLIRHGLGQGQLPLLQRAADLEVMSRRVGHSGEQGAFASSFISALTLRLLMPWGNTDGSVVETRHSVTTVKGAVKRVAEQHLADLNPYLARYSPVNEVRLSELVQVYQDPVNDAVQVRGLTIDYCVNGVWLPFDALSDGTRRLVYLITELLFPSYPQESDKIILLEEPELGIHPHQLYKLLDLIREVSEKHQVIITTHSPQVLDMLRSGELDRIIVCELKDPKVGTQFRHLTAEEQEAAHTYITTTGFLSDYWLHSDLESD